MFKKNINFRDLFLGRLFLNLGDSVIYILFMWFLYNFTRDSMFTGVAAFFFTLPSIIGIFWGPIVDRSDNKRLLTFLSKVIIISVLVLAGITKFWGINPYVILFFVPILAFASELSYPVGESLIPKIVNGSDLTKANSLIMVSSTGADLFFNAASAVIISFFTFEQLLFFIGIIFIFSYLFFNKIKYKKTITNSDDNKTKSIFKEYINDLKEGFQFIKSPLVLMLLSPLVIFNFVYAVFYVGLPEFSSVYFNSSSVYGIILMLFGIGSIIGATVSDYLSNRLKIGYLVSLCYFIAGASWILSLLTLSHNLLVFSVSFTILSGMANGIVNVAYSVLFQKLPERDMIGRVHTINMTLLNSTTPIASLLGGVVVRNFGSMFTILCCGVILSVTSLIVLLNRKFRNLPQVQEIDSSLL